MTTYFRYKIIDESYLKMFIKLINPILSNHDDDPEDGNNDEKSSFKFVTQTLFIHFCACVICIHHHVIFAYIYRHFVTPFPLLFINSDHIPGKERLFILYSQWIGMLMMMIIENMSSFDMSNLKFAIWQSTSYQRLYCSLEYVYILCIAMSTDMRWFVRNYNIEWICKCKVKSRANQKR